MRFKKQKQRGAVAKKPKIVGHKSNFCKRYASDGKGMQPNGAGPSATDFPRNGKHGYSRYGTIS